VLADDPDSAKVTITPSLTSDDLDAIVSIPVGSPSSAEVTPGTTTSFTVHIRGSNINEISMLAAITDEVNDVRVQSSPFKTGACQSI